MRSGASTSTNSLSWTLRMSRSFLHAANTIASVPSAHALGVAVGRLPHAAYGEFLALKWAIDAEFLKTQGAVLA